jgi:hypothetical protein
MGCSKKISEKIFQKIGVASVSQSKGWGTYGVLQKNP